MHPSVAFSVDDTEDWGLPLAGPGLLLDVPHEGKWLVLDGHDRMQAALLEGTPTPLLGLWPVHEMELPALPEKYEGIMRAEEHHLRAGETPTLVDRFNRMLRVNSERHRQSTVTRGWPLKGDSRLGGPRCPLGSSSSTARAPHGGTQQHERPRGFVEARGLSSS